MIDMIQTEEENRVALRMVERLMDLDPMPDSYEGMMLGALVKEVKKFEDKTYGK